MKKITTLMCAVALWCSAQAQAPALHFGRDCKVRIAQFTDVHLDLGTPYRRAQAEKTIAQMRYILEAEHPDLVVFTGDVVTGKPAAEAWHRVLEPVAERNLPFCVVLGNHDAEQDLTRAEIGRIVTSYAGALNTLGAGGGGAVPLAGGEPRILVGDGLHLLLHEQRAQLAVRNVSGAAHVARQIPHEYHHKDHQQQAGRPESSSFQNLTPPLSDPPHALPALAGADGDGQQHPALHL